jgi:hypothetical protein
MAARTNPRRLLRRPAAVLVGVFLGLGVLGTATGTALGAVGAASATPFDGHRHDAPRFDGRGYDGPWRDDPWRDGPGPGFRPGP